jgi:hypothetical protein
MTVTNYAHHRVVLLHQFEYQGLCLAGFIVRAPTISLGIIGGLMKHTSAAEDIGALYLRCVESGTSDGLR